MKLGGTAPTGVAVVNSTTITATTAAHAAGAVSVVVTNSDNQSGTLTNGYTYGNLIPLTFNTCWGTNEAAAAANSITVSVSPTGGSGHLLVGFARYATSWPGP